jgi:IS5 family transposase
MLYSVRSERLLMEQMDYNLLFRWFVGLSMDDEVWDASTFSKNRERLLEGDIAEAFFQGVLVEARAGALLSDEHFTVDGTLLEAWASHKSFRPVDAVAQDKKDDEPKSPAPRWDAWVQIKDTTNASSSTSCDKWKSHPMWRKTRVDAGAGWTSARLGTPVVR